MVVDFILTVDGVNLKDESIDEFIERISKEIDSTYPILYEVTGIDNG